MSQEQRKWICCRAHGESYGLDIRWVRQIDFNPKVLPLPTADPPLVGLMDWQGQQVPAISLDLILGGGKPEYIGAALMLELGGHRLGLLVQEVDQTLAVPEDTVFRLGITAAVSDDLVSEAAKLGDDLVFGLNVERIPLVGPSALGDIKNTISVSVNSP